MNDAILRAALAAYWRAEECGQRALNVQRGGPLDAYDLRAIKAIAAFNAEAIEKQAVA